MTKKPLSAETAELLRQAGREAHAMGHGFVGTEHLLLAFLAGQHGTAAQLLHWMGWEYGLWRSLVLASDCEGTERLPTRHGMTAGACRVLRMAAREAAWQHQSRIEPEHLLLALARDGRCTAMQIMAACGVPPSRIFSEVYDSLLWQQVQEEQESMKLVDQFCEDMIAAAQKTDPVIGRERETETVMEILCRKQKNNPALIGEPGVGKTAIVEGLAQRMAVGRVPEQLRGKRLMSLNLASLLAGTKYRGEFEERVRDIVQEIRRSGNVILFLDEMHTIVGAGSAEGAIDAANLLKPALGRGEIQLIGATTVEEYRKYIEKDAALERRFRPVTVREPSPAETMAILRGLRPGLEAHHGLRITGEALQAAIDLSCRYLSGCFLPDKAIDLLDEGAACARMRSLRTVEPELEVRRQDLSVRLSEAVQRDNFEEAVALRDELQTVLRSQMHRTMRQSAVTEEDIAQVLSRRTGIPLGRICQSERERMLSLEEELQTRVKGQREAVHAVAAAVRRGRAGLRESARPVASLLFTGPTGVGKTELCKALAEQVYGTAEALIRLDMTEFMEQHTVSRLLGAPPGYVGHGEGGELTEKVRRRPYSVVLFDEIEKAHRDVTGLLLQIMDDGVLTDAAGRKTDFRNCILIMTSNLGSGQGGPVGFEQKKSRDRDSACLRQHFSPEFLGRIDCVAAFAPLSESTMTEIAVRQLSDLRQRAETAGLHMEIAAEVGGTLAACCTGSGGARQLRRHLREQVEDPLTELMLAHPTPPQVAVETENGKIKITVR